MRENELNETAKCLQSETKVNLDYIEDRNDFKLKVTTGKWDQVLEDLSQLNLSLNTLSEVHEQVNVLNAFLLIFTSYLDIQ